MQMSEEVFTTELPDLKGFIHELDLLDEKVQKAVSRSMRKGAHRIRDAQRRRIAGKVPKLAEAITVGDLRVFQNGTVTISSGYQPEAFIEHKGENLGVIGMTYEFGRPGESPQRSGETMKQRRRGKNGKIKEVTVSKGMIAPEPHIRRGFDDVIESAVDEVINEIETETGKVFDG